MPTPSRTRLEPWPEHDPPLVPPLAGDRRMLRYLPRADESAGIDERYRHFLEHHPRQFRVVAGPTNALVGWIAYWDRIWNAEPAFEVGWGRLPGEEATDLVDAVRTVVEQAASDSPVRWLVATPSVEDDTANAICETIGLSLIDVQELEFRAGAFVTCNVWGRDLSRA